MPNKLQKAINLAQKTGDRIIVYDYNNPDNTYVIMSIDEYERLALGKNEVRNLTEDELLDKINRDIAVWKNEQIDRNVFEDKFENKEDYSDYSNSYFEKVGDNLEKQMKKDEEKKRNHWVIPSKRKEAAEEVIEEDRQYLEDVNY